MIGIRETCFWAINLQIQYTLSLFKQLWPSKITIEYSALHSTLPILLLHSNGVSIASIKILLKLGSLLYFQAPNNISTPMVVKMEIISLECSRQVTGLSSGLSTTLESIQVQHFVLQEGLLMVKKSLLLNIQVLMSPQSTQELL
jgi:hypothetical protein